MIMNECKTIDLDQRWELIERVIRILENHLEQFSYEDHSMLYSPISKICTQEPPRDYTWQLYDYYRKSFKESITSTVLPSLRENHDQFMLRELVRRWTNHKIMDWCLSHLFEYLGRSSIPRTSVLVLNKVGNTCFRDLVYQELKGKVRDVVISLIDQEREGEQIDRALLKNVLDFFVEIGMGKLDYYENDFEAAMLKDTAAYYSQKASKWILADSCPVSCTILESSPKVDECLKWEKDRVSHYLHHSSEPKLLQVVQNACLSVYGNQLLDNGHFHALLRDGKVADSSRMHKLFSKMNRVLQLVNIFKQHVTAEGTDLIKQAQDVASNKKVFMRQLIELHDKYLAYVNDCFQNDTRFCMALKEAFEGFCNEVIAGSSSAELLATFCDNILRKGGSEKLSDEAIEETLEKVVKMLAYISDKDRFAEFYRKKLARRLIFDKSAYKDHEGSVLIKLKKQCGGHLTSRMERMITDFKLAGKDQANFEKYLIDHPHSNPGINLTVAVLCTGVWPSYKSIDLNLPAEMVKCVEVFGKFYQTENKMRKLKWIYSLGNCELIGNFESKRIELILTTYQASALLLFNASNRLSYLDMKTQLNLNDDDLIRLLHSLSCMNYKILNKEPDTKIISPDDYFEFNSKFTNKMRRIKIPLPPVDEKKVVTDVNKDRQFTIDALIVRIMKRCKVLSKNQLVEQCVKQCCMFKPDSQTIIEGRIVSLMRRDYLEKDGDSPDVLKFLP